LTIALRASLALPPLLGGDVWDQHQLLVEVVAVHGLPDCFPRALKAQLAGGGAKRGKRRAPVSKGFGLKVCACRVVPGAEEGGASSAAAEAEHGPIAVQHIDGYEGHLDLAACGDVAVASRVAVDRASLPGSALAAGASAAAAGVECGAISIRVEIFWDAIHSGGGGGGGGAGSAPSEIRATTTATAASDPSGAPPRKRARPSVAAGSSRSSNAITTAAAIVQKRHVLGRAFIPSVAVAGDVARFPLHFVGGAGGGSDATAAAGGADAPWVSVRLWRPKLRRVKGCGETMTEKELRRHIGTCVAAQSPQKAGAAAAATAVAAKKKKVALRRGVSMYAEESDDDDESDDEDY
jgi:hypothetical protein